MSSASCPSFWVVIPAAGYGVRMGADRPKQYLQLAGNSVIEHTLRVFLGHPGLRALAVVIAPDDPYWLQLPCATEPRIVRAQGGEQRAASVLNGLLALQENGAEAEDWVLVHDAARPNLAVQDLDRLLSSVVDDEVGGILAAPVRDTLKRSDGAGGIKETLDRSELWQAFTPQMFRLGLLQTSLAEALAAGLTPTDEAAALEWAGYSPRLVQGRSDNIKITRPEDLQWMQRHLGQDAPQPDSDSQ